MPACVVNFRTCGIPVGRGLNRVCTKFRRMSGRRTNPISGRKFGSTTSRSAVPVACTLDVLGDRWTLLVVRDLIRGKRRFAELVESPERIPTNILADRLKRLV